jgi:hypothetical protein
MCNVTLQEHGLFAPLSSTTTLITNASADGVTLFLTKEGFWHLLHNFTTFRTAYEGTLNMQKSTGLSRGRWKNRLEGPAGFRQIIHGEIYTGICPENNTMARENRT